MATLRKVGNKWEAQVAKKGVRKSKSFFTKAEAANWAALTEAAILADKNAGTADMTFGQLLEYYRDNVSIKKRGSRPESMRIASFLRDPIAAVHLRDLNVSHFTAWRERRSTTVGAASIIREFTILSHACRLAVSDWKWLGVSPCKGMSLPKEPKPRDRRVSQQELDALMFQFGSNPLQIQWRVGQAFLFAIETGMRASEITGLTLQRIHLDKRYVTVSSGKSDAAKRDVPLTTAAVEILRGLPSGVFELTAAQIDANFRRAKARALVEDLHFHDSRHEAITRLAQKLSILDLARMVGHKDLRMLQVYYNSTAEEMAARLD